MNENQINTMNLENNIGGVTPPVFSGITKSIPNTADEIKVNNQDIQNDLNADIESKSEPIILDKDITIPTTLLRDMVIQARKVGVANNMQPISEVLNLIIDENGITMKATGGGGKPDFICVDKKYISTKKLSVSLDIHIFGDYLNAERNNTITLNFVENENTLYINTETGMRKFPQRMDSSTHQPIIHDLKFPYNYEDMMAVDYDRLVRLVNLSSSARDLANKLSVCDFLQGLYCGDDILVASDGNIMTIQPNQTEFKSEIFFLDNTICNLITSIKFDTSKFRAGITKQNGDVKGITFSDGRITICGPLSLDNRFPVEPAKKYWSSTGFTQSIQFETRALADVLKSITPFIPNMGDAVDKITLDIRSDEVEIKSYDNTSKVVVATEVIKVINNTNYITSSPLAVPLSKLEKILQSIDSDNFELLIDPNADNCVCLSYDGIRNILTTLTNN